MKASGGGLTPYTLRGLDPGNDTKERCCYLITIPENTCKWLIETFSNLALTLSPFNFTPTSPNVPKSQRERICILLEISWEAWSLKGREIYLLFPVKSWDTGVNSAQSVRGAKPAGWRRVIITFRLQTCVVHFEKMPTENELSLSLADGSSLCLLAEANTVCNELILNISTVTSTLIYIRRLRFKLNYFYFTLQYVSHVSVLVRYI